MTPELLFPYMVWAQTESFVSPWCLAQSGMPVPEASFLDGAPLADLSMPPVDAVPRLRARLAELFGVEDERVLVTVGASGAMLAAAMRYFRGARVVTEVPSYEPFRELPPLFGAETRVVARRLEEGWRLDPARVAAELEGCDRPGHVFIATPHNPTGAVSSPEELQALAAAAERAGGILISNEVYMEFAPNEERVHAFALAPNALSIGSLTKAYGLGSLRVGWIILGEGLRHEFEHLRDMAFLGWVDPPTPSCVAGRVALQHLTTLIQPARRFTAECRPHLVRWLEEEPRVEGIAPTLGLAAFPRIRGVDDTRALQAFLAREWQVDVGPGEFFGAPGHVRVGYGVPEETLVEGLRRLSQGLEAFGAEA